MLQQRSLLLSAIAAVLLRPCIADVDFSSPAAGATISGTTIDVEFAEGSGTPPLADFTTYTLQLCAGGNTQAEYTILHTFTDKGSFSTATTYSAELTTAQLTLGGNTKNAYFLRTIGVAPGGVVYNFSPRFTLSEMTGTFPANIQTALTKISGTAGPVTVNSIADPQNAAPAVASGDPASYSMAYTMQTGPIRYAPMAVVAPSKITAKGNARQHPTSAWNVWRRSGMPNPDATQTVTNPQTFAVQSMEATIAPAGQPGDMQRFLERWKD